MGCFERPPSWPQGLPERLAHLTARDYVEYDLLPEALFREFYKFAVIRDPVERAISMWRYLPNEMSFDAFVLDELTPGLEAGHFYYQSQCAFLLDREGSAPLVDHVVPFSELAGHWPEVQRRAGLSAPLGHRNKAPDARPAPCPSVASVDRIRALYADDYARFERF